MNNLLLVCKKPFKTDNKQKHKMYTPKCVNRQIEHIKEWCSADNIYVYTDFNKEDFCSDAKIIEIPDTLDWRGWWSKVFMYGNSPKGLNLFLDLDTEVYGNGDDFWNIHSADKPVLWFEEHWDRYNCGSPRINGSVIRWSDNQLKFIYDIYIEDPHKVQQSYKFGDDHFLTANIDESNYYLFPSNFCHSMPEILRKNPTMAPSLPTMPEDLFEGDNWANLEFKIFTYPNNLKPSLLCKKYKHIADYWKGAF